MNVDYSLLSCASHAEAANLYYITSLYYYSLILHRKYYSTESKRITHFFLRFKASSSRSRWACFRLSSIKYFNASLRRTSFELNISLKYFSSSSRRFSIFSGESLVIPNIFFLGKGGLSKLMYTDFWFCCQEGPHARFGARCTWFWKSTLRVSSDLWVERSK